MPVSATLSAKPVVMPPIAQESAQEQFRAQVLAAPTVHTCLHNKIAYTLADVKVTQVIYSAKEDVFTINFNWGWLPAMPSDGPGSDTSTLQNDGYGHYYGTVYLTRISPNGEIDRSQSADITIK